MSGLPPQRPSPPSAPPAVRPLAPSERGRQAGRQAGRRVHDALVRWEVSGLPLHRTRLAVLATMPDDAREGGAARVSPCVCV